jgi:hypothetical protein
MTLDSPMILSAISATIAQIGRARMSMPHVATDFRRVYATVLENWLRLEAKPVLGGDFELLP